MTSMLKRVNSWTDWMVRRSHSTNAERSPIGTSGVARAATSGALRRFRAEDAIPDGRADAEPDVRGLVVVEEVVALQKPEKTPVHREVVRRVVGHDVHDVPGDEAREERAGPGGSAEDHADHQVEEPVEEERQRDAQDRRHHEPGLALRLLVVDAVDQVPDPLQPRLARLVVEEEAVKKVFRARPHEDTRHVTAPER